MSKKQYRRGPARVAQRIVILFSLAMLAGCGGSSTSKISQPPPPPPPPPGNASAGPFFGIDTNKTTDPWPATLISLASWRSLGGSVKWADINTADGIYDWSTLDQWMSKAQAGGQDVMFTVYATPTWASSRGINCVAAGTPPGCIGPANTSCALAGKNGPGICDPPNDLNCDGTGTNLNFQNFVTALLNHEGAGKIKYWELWNEPNVPSEWNAVADCPSTPNASFLMLARMASDLKTIVSAADPKALFTTPAAAGGSAAVSNWLNGYVSNSNGASFADIIAFHGYINQGGVCPTACPQPEKVVDVINGVKTVATTSGQQSKPLFDTEGSWGDVNDVNAITDPDQQAAFLGRYYLLQMGTGIAKFYWFGWDFPSSGYLQQTGSLTLAGTAYVQIVNWTAKATVQPCAANGTQWSCVIVGSASQSMAMWDSSQTCSLGVCTTTNVSAPVQFTSYLDLAGNKHSITNGSVPVGLKPILLTTG